MKLYRLLSFCQMRYRACALLLISAVFVVGCTTHKTAYNFLDWAMQWQVGRYVSLHPEQKAFTKDAINSFLSWHRATQLPLYADYLETLHARLEKGPITAAEIHTETDRVQLMLDKSLDRLIPDAVRLLASLTDQQVEQLLEKIAEKRQEYRKEYIAPPPDELHKNRVKKLEKYLSKGLGRLTKQQEQWLEEWSRGLLPYAELAEKQRQAWERQLAVLLQDRKDIEALESGLRQLMFYRTDNWDPELERIMDVNQELTYETVAKILNHRTDKQDKKLDKKFAEYITDARSLAAQAQ